MGHASDKLERPSRCLTLTGPLKSHLSPRTFVARWAPHPASSSARLGAVVSGDSVAEGTLTGPLKSHLSPRSCVVRWATHPPSSIARPGAVVSGESVAECTLTGPY
ncbi:hypothetical protein DPMN_089342 [Dreissena polymorpha]|uniref:Uncharacterized protein n=1 Tax=Dreissena polymorpha TaxID=45954 RepID=A0A9D4KW83_DREPO|nr:hypothetical protein DPMN_089342 [Dreissena polymorpha]